MENTRVGDPLMRMQACLQFLEKLEHIWTKRTGFTVEHNEQHGGKVKGTLLLQGNNKYRIKC